MLLVATDTMEADLEGSVINGPFDAHDMVCARRHLTRVIKAAKEAAKTEREAQAASQEKAKK